jgi:hypothetical protein
MARIVVCGYMVRHPVAGNLLAFFQYALGLHRLGHEVVYLEESGWPFSCYDPETSHWYDHPSSGLRIVRDLIAAHQAPIPVIYINRETGDVDGASRDEVERRLRETDLLLNVGGVCYLPEFALCRRRAIIDMDPLFTQVERFGARTLADYHVHFSYGANIGRDGCTIPTREVAWRPTVPPVVLDLWEWAQPSPDAPFTTVANWGSYGGVTYEGEHYGQKDQEFLRVIDLPRRASARFELALSGGQESRARMRDAGWSVKDAGDDIGIDTSSYVKYILNSRGEFSVAKGAYVKSRSGWFSDRSACYLASGLPVILQETGFSDWLPTGRGVLTYRTLDEAVGCVAEIARDYPGHRRAARELAERVFAHQVVLPQLLDRALEGESG